MSFLDGWNPKLEWKKEGKGFCVIVSKHKGFDDESKWCVYLYVYPSHPAFERFNKEGTMWEQPYFECHSYVSYFRPHIDHRTNEVVSYQLGWDYNHDGDHYYTTCETPSDASNVFWDADNLFRQASEWGEE